MQIDVADYYRKYGPMVLRRCRAMLGDEDRAMDAMQEVFVKLLQSRETLKGTYPSSLLYRIATNVCLNIIRYEKSRPESTGDALLGMFASADDIENRIVARDLLERIFETEKESTAEIAFMHYIDKMTLAEVAEVSGLSVSGVRKRLRKLTENVNYLEGVR